MTIQTLIVLAIAAGAFVYVVRHVARQFRRSEDEAEGCSGCPANKEKVNRSGRRSGG